MIDIYGSSEATKLFFIEELVDEMKDEYDEDEEVINAPFEHTENKKLEDVVDELPNVIHKPFGYYEYSEMDESNDRFMRKQESTNSLRDTIFDVQNFDNDNKPKKKKNEESDLFKDIDGDVPF